MLPIEKANLLVIQGSDSNAMIQHNPVLRREMSDKEGKFKFLKLKQSIYSFYGNKEAYVEDSFSIPVIGLSTIKTIPILHLLPDTFADYG